MGLRTWLGLKRQKKRPRSLIYRVDEIHGDLPYMRIAQAELASRIIADYDCKSLLELGTASGKSAAYFAAILEDLGRGHLTTLDRSDRLNLPVNVNTVLSSLELTHRVTPLVHPRTFAATLRDMLDDGNGPRFDFAYLDAGKTWETVALGFLLVDRLLLPGAIVVFDDLNWTASDRAKRKGAALSAFANYSDEECSQSQTRKVWKLLVHGHYKIIDENNKFGWGIARKP